MIKINCLYTNGQTQTWVFGNRMMMVDAVKFMSTIGQIAKWQIS